VTDKSGLAEGLFAGWRYHEDRSPVEEFPLNQAASRGAEILLVGDNFGCGSSREHAVWALMANHFRAVISSSFADIFRSNALKNGLLTVEIPEGPLAALFRQVEQDPEAQVTVDLPEQTLLLPDGSRVPFSVDPFSKLCLMEGVDPLGYLIQHEPEIAAYERADRKYAAGNLQR
jgi:3-isopropylmalate/(R)-2-methylmalate dehydratase small subunit